MYNGQRIEIQIRSKLQHLWATAYDKAEKDTERDPNTQVVLVSVDHVDALRKAYPNYYVDTQGFISAVEKEMNNK